MRQCEAEDWRNAARALAAAFAEDTHAGRWRPRPSGLPSVPVGLGGGPVALIATVHIPTQQCRRFGSRLLDGLVIYQFRRPNLSMASERRRTSSLRFAVCLS